MRWNYKESELREFILDTTIQLFKLKGLKFTMDELAAVARAEVVPSQYGNSVCFFMNGGGQTYIPLLSTSSLTVGDSVDLKTAKLVTLCREGYDDIYRVIE